MASKLLVVGVLAVILGISLAATQNAATTTVSVRASGSNVPSNLFSAWTSDFGSDTKGVVNAYYGAQSTATVKSLFTTNSVDFAVVDVPLTAAERTDIMQKHDTSIAHAPVAVAGLAFVYNLPGFTSASPLKLTPALIGGILDGTITAWNDTRLTTANDMHEALVGSTLAIKPVVYSESAGTTYTLTRYLQEVGVWSTPSYTLTAQANTMSVSTYTSVASTVASNSGAIGYVAYGDVNNLLTASLQYADTANIYIQPSTAAFAAAAATVDSELPIGTDLWEDDLLLATVNDANPPYPISFFVHAIFNVDQAPNGATGAATGAFLGWAQLASVQAKVASYGFAPLSTAALTNNNNTLNGLTYASGTATTDYYPYVAPAAPVTVAPVPVAAPTLEKISSSAIQIIIIIVLVIVIALVVAFDQYRGGCIIRCQSTGRGVWA